MIIGKLPDTLKIRLNFQKINKIIFNYFVDINKIDDIFENRKKLLLTYLKLSDKKLGLLINFNSSNLKDNIVRIVNNL